ncbi:hypothetical protein [Enterobacter asburiae]|uniref:hypothetical protein n=1 Tax=Enterobacter asburiae TaxID=61645 RepID=UPI0021D2DC4D|nr:hypothetical protein [Enterobacter asburiae]MCU6243805.1 hypothetical protein [Enterobacter asburiae]
MEGDKDTPAGPDATAVSQTAARQRKVTAKSTSRRLHYLLLRLRWCLWYLTRQCRQAGARLHANVTQWMYRHTRLRWCALVMVSRRRVVAFPLLGPLNINGVRLWLLCIVLIVGGLIRGS